MPAVKFFVRLDLDPIFLFPDGHYLVNLTSRERKESLHYRRLEQDVRTGPSVLFFIVSQKAMMAALGLQGAKSTWITPEK